MASASDLSTLHTYTDANGEQSSAEHNARTALSAEASSTRNVAGQPTDNATATQSHVKDGTIPDLQLVDTAAGSANSAPHNLNLLGTIESVGKDLWSGISDEVMHHPDKILEAGATGLAVGAAAVGLALVAPEAVAVAAGVGALVGGYQLATHLGGWIHDADVIGHAGDDSATDVAAAHADLQRVGQGTALVGAGMLGSVAGGGAMMGVSSLVSGAMADTALSADASAALAPNAAVDSYGAASLASDGAGANAASAAVSSVEAPAAAASSVEAPAAAADSTAEATISATTTPEVTQAITNLTDPNEIGEFARTLSIDSPQAAQAQISSALENGQIAPGTEPAWQDALANVRSIESNQGFFRAAAQDGDLVPSIKQLYNVKFTKITEPTTVPTLENPDGVQVTPGVNGSNNWIATRLDDQGQPVIENGHINQWTIADKAIKKTYVVQPDDLNDNSFVAPTNTEAPPVTMIKITPNMVDPATGEFKMQTAWGPMTGKAGDYLANYNYDTAAGQPGQNYAIVTNTSYNQTYQPVNASETTP